MLHAGHGRIEPRITSRKRRDRPNLPFARDPNYPSFVVDSRRLLGEILVAEGIVSGAALEAALKDAESAGRRIGEHLVTLGLLNETQLAQALAHQLSVPWVSLSHVEFTPELLERIPVATAEECCAVPVLVQREKGVDKLCVAFGDPTHLDAIAQVTRLVGLQLVIMIASPTEIRNAIKLAYHGLERIEGTEKAEKVPPPLPPRQRPITLKMDIAPGKLDKKP